MLLIWVGRGGADRREKRCPLRVVEVVEQRDVLEAWHAYDLTQAQSLECGAHDLARRHDWERHLGQVTAGQVVELGVHQAGAAHLDLYAAADQLAGQGLGKRDQVGLGPRRRWPGMATAAGAGCR